MIKIERKKDGMKLYDEIQIFEEESHELDLSWTQGDLMVAH